MTWFERLTGFPETTPEEVRAKLSVGGGRLESTANGGSWAHGGLEVVSLAGLRERVSGLAATGGKTGVREIVADVQKLHADPDNGDALFQVASQFNLLEMA